MTYTKEPCRLGERGKVIFGELGDIFCDTDDSVEDARRIVACVNELAGKPEGYVAKLEQQNAELLEALKKYGRHAGDCIANHLPLIKNTADGSDSRACSCGFYKALASVEGE